MNWKQLGRKRSWSNEFTMPIFVQSDRGINLISYRGESVSPPRFEPPGIPNINPESHCNADPSCSCDSVTSAEWKKNARNTDS
jgi:hypothetical protein